MTVKKAGTLKQISFVKLDLNSVSPVANCYVLKSGVSIRRSQDNILLFRAFQLPCILITVWRNGLKYAFLVTIAFVHITAGIPAFVLTCSQNL